MDHTIALIQKSHEGDDEARAQIVEENTGLVWCIVRRFAGRGTEMEDLFQIGTIGLLKAIDKFDLSFEVKISTYTVSLIRHAGKRGNQAVPESCRYDQGQPFTERTVIQSVSDAGKARKRAGKRAVGCRDRRRFKGRTGRTDDGNGCMYGCGITAQTCL